MYIQITDPKMYPDTAVDMNTNDIAKFKTRDIAFNQLLNRYKPTVFTQVLPNASTKFLREIFYIEYDNDNFPDLLIKNFRDKVPLVELLCNPVTTGDSPNDPLYNVGVQTDLDLINASDAWEIAKHYPSIKVAIIDCPFDETHEDLIFDSIHSNGNHRGNNHGTFVAGRLGSTTNNGIGIASIGGYNTSISISNHMTDLEVLRLAQAGYRVINCSWFNSCEYSQAQEAIYNEIRNVYNTVVVFGAGNGTNHCNGGKAYPPSYESCVSVTSVGHKNEIGIIAPEENGKMTGNWKDVHELIIDDTIISHQHNDAVDICAPGYYVYSTGINNTYYASVGTSFAAPQVAGVAAMIIAVNPYLTANEVVEILKSTANTDLYSIPQNSEYIGKLGAGRLDAYAAVKKAKEIIDAYLIIRDDKEDTGIEPNPQAIQWNSPDIWLVDDNYNPIPITELDNYSSCHIAVRIKNVGNTTTTGKERLSVYWSKSAYKSKWKASWSGSNIYQRLFGLPKGDEISPEGGFILSTPLQPNEERIYYFPFNIPEKLTTQRKEIDSKIAELIKMKIPMSWGFAILAKINDGNDIDGENGMMINTTTFAQNSNNVAVNNGGLLIFKDRLTRMVIIDDLIQQPVSFDFNQLPTKDNFTLSDFAEIGVALSQDLMNKIIVDKCKNVRIIKNKNIVLLTSPNARLSFAPLNSNSEIYFIGLTVNFISDIMPELNEFDIDVILSTENDSEIKRFTAIRDEHVYFKAHAGASKTVVVKAKESVTLTSNIISDEATYIWYDEAGNVIGEESKISVTPDISQTYTVEIEKVTDGYKSYDSIRVEVVEGMINNLSPNPARDEVKIEYSLSDNVQSASIQISDMQNIVVLTYPVQVSETQRMIPLGSLTPGVYFLKLLIDGQTIDSKQLIINQ